MEVAKWKITRKPVRNKAKISRQIAHFGNKKHLDTIHHSSNLQLLAAILKRKTEYIATIVDPSLHQNDGQFEPLSDDLYRIMTHAYGALLEKPVLLAMKLASSETTETTKDNEPTRLDVLHCLASHFDDLVTLARQEGQPSPDLNEILDFGRAFDTAIPLHTFILGLPEHRKDEAAEILNAKIAANG